MNRFEPSDDDVVSIDPNLNIVKNNPTVRVSQLVKVLKEYLTNYSVPATVAETWLGEGAECELLTAFTGQGWQTGKIRIRFEFVPDVLDIPELTPTDTDPYPDQQ
jgi:hypothetical protein